MKNIQNNRLSLMQAKYVKPNTHILTEYFFDYHSAKHNSVFCLKVWLMMYFCSPYLNTWTCKKEINIAMRAFIISSSSYKLYQYLMRQSKDYKHLLMTG